MAVPSGTYQTYQQVGIREDLAEIIGDISPMDTPVLTNAKKGKAENTFVEWQIDELAAAAHSASIEGDDATNETASPTNRIGNYTQIVEKAVGVTGTSQAVNTAGRANELNREVQKRSKELKRNLETSLCGLQAAAAGNASTARALGGLGVFLFENNVVVGSGSSTPALTSGAPTTAPTAGTDGALTEADLKAGFKAAWDEGGSPSVVLCGSTEKQNISAFTGIATQYRDNPGKGGPAVIIGAADVYISDFGQHYIVANRFQPVDNVYILDFDYLSVKWLRDWQMTPLAKTGDADRVQILGEATLCNEVPKAHSKLFTTNAT